MTPKTLPTNYSAFISGGTAAIGCEYDGARWHVWVNPTTLECDSPLYKNPPLGTKMHTPGYFKTRHLDRLAKANKWMFDLMIAHAPAAIEAARKVDAAKKAAEDADHAAIITDKRVREAAPEMLDALKMLQAAADTDGWPIGWGIVKDRMIAAITKAEGVQS